MGKTRSVMRVQVMEEEESYSHRNLHHVCNQGVRLDALHHSVQFDLVVEDCIPGLSSSHLKLELKRSQRALVTMYIMYITWDREPQGVRRMYILDPTK
jgi:hypothetical protein